MTRTWFYADPHFGHEAICRFTRDGSSEKLRPFDTAAEMDKELLYRYMTTVKREDKVYWLGDITFKPQGLHLLHSLPGDKVLIKGNHDTLKAIQYLNVFRDIRACHILSGVILTHIPIHPESVGRWKANVHGHLHHKEVRVFDDKGPPDPRYLCVSVEHTDYAPILLEDALDRIKQRQGSHN
jgi:calcineurin-like phosphoesterase family protein